MEIIKKRKAFSLRVTSHFITLFIHHYDVAPAFEVLTLNDGTIAAKNLEHLAI